MPNKQIRLLGPHEVYRLNPLIAPFLETTKVPNKVDFNVFLRNWTSLIVSGIGLVGVVDKGEETGLSAAIGGISNPDINSGEKTFIELFFYSKENGDGLRLLRFLEKEVARRGARQFYMASSCYHDDFERTCAFYERLGYVKDSVAYRKEMIRGVA